MELRDEARDGRSGVDPAAGAAGALRRGRRRDARRKRAAAALLLAGALLLAQSACASAVWVRRDTRAPVRGPWRDALRRELPILDRELNGIDFGHAHLAETLLAAPDPARVESARREVLEFIASLPAVPPDEEQIAPTMHRLAWEAQRVFDWSHLFHRSLYDLFASDAVADKEAAYRSILADYLDDPSAVTTHRLDHHTRLWGFPESRSFRDRFPAFNSQIWVYHWLQATAYEVQLMGGAARQRALLPRLLERYHAFLERPPVEWTFMPLMPEGAPEFSRRFPEAATIFDNMHMLHDNLDDILCRPDLYPTPEARRRALLEILPIYLHRNHEPQERYAEFEHPPDRPGHAGHGGHGGGVSGPRPPSAEQVLAGGGGRR